MSSFTPYSDCTLCKGKDDRGGEYVEKCVPCRESRIEELEKALAIIWDQIDGDSSPDLPIILRAVQGVMPFDFT